MKIPCLIISSLFASALAAPAVVWKKSRRSEHRFLHTADELSASDLLKNVLDFEDESSLPNVVFLVGKSEDGSESLSELASSGKLPSTAAKYSDADGIFHHVSGIESTSAMVREASRSNSGVRALQVTLSEFNSKLTSQATVDAEVVENGMMSKSAKHATKRARELASANVFIVNIDPKDDAAKIDTTIANTIENANVNNVVLAGIRSTSEVKHERYMASRRRMTAMEAEGQRVLESRRRRRLEQEEQQGDQGDDDAANNGNDNSDMSGVYYVAMTPNIFAGLLFGLLFVVISWIGITCMGGIAGQDTYVTKMPTIGREA